MDTGDNGELEHKVELGRGHPYSRAMKWLLERGPEFGLSIGGEKAQAPIRSEAHKHNYRSQGDSRGPEIPQGAWGAELHETVFQRS